MLFGVASVITFISVVAQVVTGSLAFGEPAPRRWPRSWARRRVEPHAAAAR